MINDENKKNHTISLGDVINELENSEYKDRYELCRTQFAQNEERWNRRSKFEEILASKVNDGKGIKYFAYIKFYMNGDKKCALVAGKSGSKLVNQESDVKFLSYPQNEGEAKKWLYDQSKEWYVEKILIIWALAENKEENEQEAFEIERTLKEMFGLFGS